MAAGAFICHRPRFHRCRLGSCLVIATRQLLPGDGVGSSHTRPPHPSLRLDADLLWPLRRFCLPPAKVSPLPPLRRSSRSGNHLSASLRAGSSPLFFLPAGFPRRARAAGTNRGKYLSAKQPLPCSFVNVNIGTNTKLLSLEGSR